MYSSESTDLSGERQRLSFRRISDFRELNKRIKRQPYPIPKIQNLLLKLEGFKYGTALDLNMGYYHIELSDSAKELCTITTQWGKYEYQRLLWVYVTALTSSKRR